MLSVWRWGGWQRVLFVSALFCPLGVAASVAIQGLNTELEANARAHLSLDDEPCGAPDWRVRRLLRRGQTEIRTALEALGHYQVTVAGELSQQPDCWQATYRVVPGDPVVIRRLRIDVQGPAGADPSFTRLVAGSALRVGVPFQHDHYEGLKRNLLELASRRGYADAVLADSRVDVFPAEGAADVQVTLDGGERYAFGDVRFQQDVLETDLVGRFVPFRRGEPYDSRRLGDFYSALAAGGYFERITVEPLLKERRDGEIPVAVTLTPGKRQLYTAGVGYSTDTGPRGRLGYTNRRVNAHGHQWGANLLVSKVVSEVSTNYRLPFGDPTEEWLSFDGGYKHEDTDSSTSDAYELGVRRIKDRGGGWLETLFLDLLYEDFVVGEQKDDSTLVMPGISWRRTQADDAIRPTRGLRLFLEVRGSADALGSDVNFLRAAGQAKWVRRILPRSRVILRAEAGVALTEGFSELPPSVRFFAGGDASIRGYDFKSLGPKDADGNVIGGSGKLIASAEYEFDIRPKWSIATFVDSGNAFDDFDLEPQTGVGAGFRWQSPVGPIRVDLAKPLNGVDRDVRLHVTFGPDL